jgi:glycosyltransferase involved in cell wall biosynthesis
VAKKVLFLSYNGLLEPILPSQAVPYMEALAGKGFEFILFTYEKGRDLERLGAEEIEKKRRELKERGIDWRYLKYHKNPPVLSTLFDLIAGAAQVRRIVKEEGVSLVHIRGITPGMIVLLISRMLKTKLLFDMRGLLAEEYAAGGLWREDGARFKLVKSMESRMLRIADGVTVLTDKHLQLNRGLEELKDREVVMDVVPCCVDTDRFRPEARSSAELKKKLGLEGKMVLMYPGKIGTFYLMKEMLDFYKVMSEMVKESVFVILTNDDTLDVKRRARELGIGEERIIFLKGVDFSLMPDYMAMADAGLFFINPYKKIGSSPIKMGEFLSSGVPVVINPGVGDTEELVDKNRAGVVVKEFKATDYSSAVNALLALMKEGQTLKARCRQTAEDNLSLKHGVEKYLDVYNALLGGPQR